MAYGFKGAWTVSDCATMMNTFTEDLKQVGRATAAVLSAGGVIQPFFRAQTAMVSFSNVNTACQATAFASQLNIRFNTNAGRADLAYTIYNVAKEGFFDGLYDNSIDNVIWTNSYRLYQGTFDRHSMSCVDVGFHMGSIMQALINFNVPDT